MGLYPLNCPCCDKVFTDRKPYSKHKGTQKYRNNMLEKENYRLKLDLEKFKLQNNINITINNIDNSQNTVNNVFVFNTPDRMNFNDFIENIPDVDTIYNSPDFDGIGTIQRQFLRLDRHKRPVMIKAKDLLVKNNDEVFKGAEAREVVNKEFHKLLWDKWFKSIDSNDSGKYMNVMQGMMETDLDNFMRKIKCELTYKETDK